jgi:hypothetical protein
MHGGEEKCIQNVGWKNSRKEISHKITSVDLRII